MNAAHHDLAALRDLRTALAPLMFSIVPIDGLDEHPPPAPSYWWDGYMPAGVVTMLGAHGGVGKSTVALMLAVAIARGLPLFGRATKQGRVAYFSAEDPSNIIRHRLHQVLRHFKLKVGDLGGRLHLLDATDFDPELFIEIKGHGTTTPTHACLADYVVNNNIDVLIVDNASDAFGANEIDRHMVRGFMRSLAQMAQPAGAVLLLVHVNKASARGEHPGSSEGYSGSTAWHNSSRSRMLLTRGKDAMLSLDHQKNNVGPLLPPVTLAWPVDGLPRLEQDGEGAAGSGDAGVDKEVALLRWIHEYAERDEYVSPSTNSPTRAAALMKGDSALPAVLKAALQRKEIAGICREAERGGRLRKGVYTKVSNRHEAECWQVTEEGYVFAGIERVAPSAPSAPSPSLDAQDAMDAQAAATAAPSAPSALGGVGGARAQKKPRRARSKSTRKASADASGSGEKDRGVVTCAQKLLGNSPPDRSPH